MRRLLQEMVHGPPGAPGDDGVRAGSRLVRVAPGLGATAPLSEGVAGPRRRRGSLRRGGGPADRDRVRRDHRPPAGGGPVRRDPAARGLRDLRHVAPPDRESRRRGLCHGRGHAGSPRRGQPRHARSSGSGTRAAHGARLHRRRLPQPRLRGRFPGPADPHRLPQRRGAPDFCRPARQGLRVCHGVARDHPEPARGRPQAAPDASAHADRRGGRPCRDGRHPAVPAPLAGPAARRAGRDGAGSRTRARGRRGRGRRRGTARIAVAAPADSGPAPAEGAVRRRGRAGALELYQVAGGRDELCGKAERRSRRGPRALRPGRVPDRGGPRRRVRRQRRGFPHRDESDHGREDPALRTGGGGPDDAGAALPHGSTAISADGGAGSRAHHRRVRPLRHPRAGRAPAGEPRGIRAGDGHDPRCRDAWCPGRHPARGGARAAVARGACLAPAGRGAGADGAGSPAITTSPGTRTPSGCPDSCCTGSAPR